MKNEFSLQNLEKYVSNFMAIRLMVAELLHAGGETDEQKERQTGRQTGRYEEANCRFLQLC
jgi:hypothetical protein